MVCSLPKVKELGFAPTIQELMVGEEIAPLKLDISAQIEEGDIGNSGDGKIRSNRIKGQNFELGGVRLLGGNLKRIGSREDIQAQKSTFTSAHRLFSMVDSPLFEKSLTAKKKMEFKSLRANLSLYPSGEITWEEGLWPRVEQLLFLSFPWRLAKGRGVFMVRFY